MNKKLIIFTDLDGTLLDSNYSFKKAMPALKLIKEKGIPLILCSSKTRAEIEHYRKKLKNTHPFISENGGGIFIPKGYFKFKIQDSRFKTEERGRYFVIPLGASYPELRNVINEMRFKGFDVIGFGDMSIKEIAEFTELKTPEAKMAKKREFDEPFIFKGDEVSLRKLKQYIRSKGFKFTEGEFFHLMGNSDKGRAVEILKNLYTKQDKIITAALGDSPNDIDMFKKVEYPIIVQHKDGSYDRRIKIRGLIKAEGIGPEGWNKAVVWLLKTLFL